jgi:hypothetical protein
MQLTDVQKQQVSEWIASGAKLSDIQNRLGEEFQVRLTYMDVRLLVDDLKLTPQDSPEVVKAAEPPPETPTPPTPESAPTDLPGEADLLEEVLPPSSGKVSVAVDTLTRPGAVVSGKVTFSDGKIAEWYLDQFGRLGMVPGDPGYRPPQEDVAEFQLALEKELMSRGF